MRIYTHADDAGRRRVESQKHALETAKEKIAAAVGVEDTVEISDTALALSQAAREIQEKAAEAAAVPTTTRIAAPKAETNAPGGKVSLATRSDRDAAGDQFDAVLASLREKYDEKTAMAKFDEFMQAEGFEAIPGNGSGMKFSFAAGTGSMLAELAAMGIGFKPNFASSMNLSSSLRSEHVNGRAEFIAESTAIYDNTDTHPEIEAMLGDVRQKQNAKAQATTDLDLNAIMGKIHPSDATSVTAVDANLGAAVQKILDEAGISLEDGQSMNVGLKRNDETREYDSLTAAFSGDPELALKFEQAAAKLIKEDPSIFSQFRNALESYEYSDLSGYGLSYEDGARSLSFRQDRNLYFSNETQGNVVVADTIVTQETGYAYQKKVSDAFDVDADTMRIMTGGMSINDMQEGRGDEAFRKAQETTDAALAALRAAKEGNGKVESTMSREAHQAYRDSLPPINGAGKEANLHTSSTETEEGKAVREAREAQAQAAKEAAQEKAVEKREEAMLRVSGEIMEGKEMVRREMLVKLTDMLKYMLPGGSQALVELLAQSRG